MCSWGTPVVQIFPYHSFVRRKNIIGSRVRKARKDLRITQMELAAQLQLMGVPIDRSGIAKLESGRRPAFDIEVAAIAKALNVSISWLFEASNSSFDLSSDSDGGTQT